ncbi:chaplin family protein, partial [Planomonospora algeriensis]
MRTWVKSTTPAALLALGVMSLGTGTALADTSGDGSIGGGNQVNLPITLPIDISGNSVAVIGESEAGSVGGASVEQSGKGSGAGGNRTSGDHSILGGNQIVAPITAPINVCGNAVAVVGRAAAGCKGGASVEQSGKGSGAGGNRTSGRGSILGGNQVVAPITAPINVCGNSVGALVGQAFAGCKGGASVTGGKPGHGYHSGHGKGAGGNRTSGDRSILGGNQVVAPITAPVNVCGNSVGALVGQAFAG